MGRWRNRHVAEAMKGSMEAYRTVRHDDGVGSVIAGGEGYLAAFLARSMDDVLRSATILNRKPLRMVLKVPWGGDTVILKYYLPYRPRNPLTKPIALLRRLLWSSHAAREWRRVHRLRRHGVRTPAPLAYFEYRRGPLYRRSFYFVSIPPGGRDLKEYLRVVAPGRPLHERRNVLRAVAVFLRGLHDRGIRMDDCRWRNFIVQAEGETPICYLVDYDLVFVVRKMSLHQRIPGLVQMNHSLSQALPLSERMRFFRWYHDAGEPLSSSFRAFVTQVLGSLVTGAGRAPAPTVTHTPYLPESGAGDGCSPVVSPRYSLVVSCRPGETVNATHAAALGSAAGALAERGPVEVLVIDDGSPEQTERLLKLLQGGPVDPIVLRHERSLGPGAAWNTAMNAAMGEFVCLASLAGLPGPTAWRELVRPLEDGADVATLASARDGMLLRTLYRMLLGRAVPALTSSPRALRREAAQRARPFGNGAVGLAENLCKAILLGYRVVEVPAGSDGPGARVDCSPLAHAEHLWHLATRSGPYRGVRHA